MTSCKPELGKIHLISLGAFPSEAFRIFDSCRFSEFFCENLPAGIIVKENHIDFETEYVPVSNKPIIWIVDREISLVVLEGNNLILHTKEARGKIFYYSGLDRNHLKKNKICIWERVKY